MGFTPFQTVKIKCVITVTLLQINHRNEQYYFLVRTKRVDWTGEARTPYMKSKISVLNDKFFTSFHLINI
jgi:hypothetical protein